MSTTAEPQLRQCQNCGGDIPYISRGYKRKKGCSMACTNAIRVEATRVTQKLVPCEVVAPYLARFASLHSIVEASAATGLVKGHLENILNGHVKHMFFETADTIITRLDHPASWYSDPALNEHYERLFPVSEDDDA